MTDPHPLLEYIEATARLEIATLTKCQCEIFDWQIEDAQKRMEALRKAGVTEAILYPDKCHPPREALSLFVDALICCAFQPGGVDFGSLHFEVNREHPMDCARRRESNE
jgi:hypothetical protein